MARHVAERSPRLTAQQLVQLVTQVTFVMVFVLVVARAIRRPSRESLDVALFFGAPAVSIALSAIRQVLGLRPDPTVSLISAALILAMPLLTLRAIQAFTDLPRAVVPVAAVLWALVALAFAAIPAPMPTPILMGVLLYFAVFEGYAGFAVFRATKRARGVTRRRLQFIAAGTALLALLILLAGVAALVPALGPLLLPLGLFAGLAYLVGFAPPAALRRAWQAPDVFTFVRRTNRLVGEAAAELVYAALARELVAATGQHEALLGIWDGEREILRFWRTKGPPLERRMDEALVTRAFREQRAISAPIASPHPLAEYRGPESRYVLAVPLTAGARRIGVAALLVGKRSTYFDDDLALLQLLADQAAVVLEHRRLFDEVRDLNLSLEHSVAELRAVNDELASFAYSVSHDLRAPLRSIDGFSQILIEDKAAALGEDGRAHLDRVRAAATRMGSLIDDMLMLSRLTREDMRTGTVDVTALARSVADELRAHEPQRRVEFEANGALPAKADARLLRIALTNLLANSWKFTRDRQPAHISFGGSTREGEATFYVKDDGVGFDMRYAQKLFGAFQRLHNASEFDGTGIGLAIVQRIVHRHGGRVWAESEIGNGATFYFTLPQAEAEDTIVLP